MARIPRGVRILLSWGLAAAACGCGREEPGAPEERPAMATREEIIVSFGHFPNVTHAQGVIGHHHSRSVNREEGAGWFEQRCGEGVRIRWLIYNAGPSAMEAMQAGSLDVAYVGPASALQAYARSGGKELRILAGAAEGGSALVVHEDGGVQEPKDLRGKKVGTPQLGNTQDIACRAWLREEGFDVSLQGGDVIVVPTSNPDQLPLFAGSDLDAVWTVEPWVHRLEMEAKGTVLQGDGKGDKPLTTVLVCSSRFLRERPALAERIVAAHVDLTRWIRENPGDATEIVQEELELETFGRLSPDVVEECWDRIAFTTRIDPAAIEELAEAAQTVGFLAEVGDLDALFSTFPEKPGRP